MPRKPNGKLWVKGESGNPKGRPKIPPEIKAMRQLTNLEFSRLANKFLCMTKDEIQECIKDPRASVLELMIASIISKGLSQGDQIRLNALLERIIGKVPTPVVNQIDPALLEAIKSLEGKSTQDLLAIVSQELHIESVSKLNTISENERSDTDKILPPRD